MKCTLLASVDLSMGYLSATIPFTFLRFNATLDSRGRRHLLLLNWRVCVCVCVSVYVCREKTAFSGRGRAARLATPGEKHKKLLNAQKRALAGFSRAAGEAS